MIRSSHFRIIMSSVFVCTLLSGCGRRREVVQYEYYEPAHACSVGCHDHYYVDQNVIYVSGHRHTRNCGHYWDGNCWRKNRAARLNPRPYTSQPIHLKDRHGHYNRPTPRDRDRYNNRDRRNDRNDRRIDNARRNNNDRHRNPGRNRNRVNNTRQEKVNKTIRQKRSSDDDDRSMHRRRSGDSGR